VAAVPKIAGSNEPLQMKTIERRYAMPHREQYVVAGLSH